MVDACIHVSFMTRTKRSYLFHAKVAHLREPKTVLDSVSHAVIPGTRFRNLCGASDSLSCLPDSKAQDSGFDKTNFTDSRFHKQPFPRFRNPDFLVWEING